MDSDFTFVHYRDLIPICEVCQKPGKTIHVRNYPTDTGKLICIDCLVENVEYAVI